MSSSPDLGRLGRYELLEKLGEGGMGAVWLARLTGTGGFEKLCIVKTVLPAIARDEGFIARFLHEGRVLTQLQHANIAQVLDMGEAEGQVYLALEYVPGLDLAHLHFVAKRRQQPLAVSLAVYIVQQAAEGLAFAHSKTLPDGTALSLVHRDVSPHNVMISWDGEVKVIDFGIAKSEAKSHATATSNILGKLGYMAPEQARAEPLDHRADQYALAVTLWELLTDQPYVSRGSLTEMVVAMSSAKPRPVVNFRPDVPPLVEDILLKALAPQPDERFRTTDDFSRALSNALVRGGAMPSRQQVSSVVRGSCGEEFSAYQQRMTRISTARATPNDTAPMPPPQPATKTRTIATGPMPVSSEELNASVRPSRGPVFALVGLVVALAIGAGVVLRPHETPAPSHDTWVTPSTTADMYVDGDETYLRAGESAGVRVGQSLVVLGAAAPDGRRPKLGTADVLEVFPQLSRLHVDDAVAQVKGPRVAALLASPSLVVDAGPVAMKPRPVDAGSVVVAKPSSPVVAPRLPPPQPVVVGNAKLSGSVHTQTAPWGLGITNTSEVGWTRCALFIPGGRRADFPGLAVGERRDFTLDMMQPTTSGPELSGRIEVRCAQGVLNVAVRQ